MKKPTFTMLVAMCIALLTFASCGDDDDDIYNDVVKTDFASRYPGATDIEWDKKGDYMVADCTINGKDTDVWYSLSGVWKMTETELLITDVPEAVTSALAKTEYANWKIDDRDRLEYPDKVTVYIIEVEQGEREFDIYFSEKGDLLKTVDTSKGDDTHWPE